MLQDVVIFMHSECGPDGEETEAMDFSTDGYYTYEDNVGCISYMESEITGMGGTRTSVFVMPDRVVIDRDGPVTSRMEFSEGELSSFLYNTPYGNATMGLRTRSIRQNMNADGGNVEIDYVIDLEHTFATRNRFVITVEKAGGSDNVQPRS